MERKNYLDHGDEGEVWFGTKSEKKMIEWIMNQSLPLDLKICDLGTGNGHLLFRLYAQGFRNLTGLDYSLNAIQLALDIAKEKGIDGITFCQGDILNIKESMQGANFDLLLDKGTLDAISLMDPLVCQKQSLEDIHAAYVASASQLLVENGFLLITSCNFTHDECVALFSSHFEFHSHMKHAAMQFGGQTGQSIITLAFKKKGSL